VDVRFYYYITENLYITTRPFRGRQTGVLPESQIGPVPPYPQCSAVRDATSTAAKRELLIAVIAAASVLVLLLVVFGAVYAYRQRDKVRGADAFQEPDGSSDDGQPFGGGGATPVRGVVSEEPQIPGHHQLAPLQSPHQSTHQSSHQSAHPGATWHPQQVQAPPASANGGVMVPMHHVVLPRHLAGGRDPREHVLPPIRTTASGTDLPPIRTTASGTDLPPMFSATQ
jgi:hypothetical protein